MEYRAKTYQKQKDEIQDLILLGTIPQPKITSAKVNSNVLNPLLEVKLAKVQKAFVWINKGEVIAGSFMSGLINSDITSADIDIYFHCKEDAIEWINVNQLNITDEHVNSYVAYAPPKSKIVPRKINTIFAISFYDEKDLISRFDIRACAIAFNPTTTTLYFVDGAEIDCETKVIVYQVGCRCATIRRIVKYIDKGFDIDAGQMAILASLIKIKGNMDEELLGDYYERE